MFMHWQAGGKPCVCRSAILVLWVFLSFGEQGSSNNIGWARRGCGSGGRLLSSSGLPPKPQGNGRPDEIQRLQWEWGSLAVTGMIV